MAAKRAFLLGIIISISIMVAIAPVCLAACPCGGSHSTTTVKQPHSSSSDCVCNNDAWKKLGRGTCNMLTFPFEIPNQMSRTNNTDGPMAAFSWGLVKGIGMTAFRAIVGVYEVVSFPVPVPDGYKPILTDPEFFFEGEIW